jgi:hypothetical protein
MGTTPTTHNTAATVAQDVVAGLVDVSVSAAKAASIAAFPPLGWPIISTIYGIILSKIGALISTELQGYAAFAVIDIQTDIEKSAYNSAVSNLKQAQASGDQNAVSQAKQSFKDTLAKLIRSDGST